jgi:protease I
MFEKVSEFFNNKTQDSADSEVRELSGTRAAILATDGFEESELFEPLKALRDVGVEVTIVSPKSGKITAWNKDDWGKSISVDMSPTEAFTEDFDYLMLPGGVMNPDKLRNDPDSVAFVESFVNKKRPIAAICHGGQTLIETGMVKGKTLTSWPSLRTDFINAGANWVDEVVIVDHLLITSRKPADLPAFNEAMIKEFIDYHVSHSLPSIEGYVQTL